MAKSVDIQSLIEQANLKHDFKYDYSQVDYINSKIKVKIICPDHGVFEQLLHHHKNGRGCPDCNPKKRVTLTDFKKRCNEIHGENIKVDFSTFKNTQSKVSITCSEHGTSKVVVYNILRGQGCPTCGIELGIKSRRKDTETFIIDAKKVHNKSGLIYDRVDYVTAHEKVEIICKKHGSFFQTPHNHLKGRGCPKCGQERTANSVRNTLDFFIKNANIIHKSYYDYSLIKEYLNNKSKVEILCPKHGSFFQQPVAHLLGQGCPKCANIISKAEIEISDLIRSISDLKIINNDRKVLNGKEIDILIPKRKIGIEYNGLIFHREGLISAFGGKTSRKYHLEKTELANAKGYGLIHIFEDEWLTKREIVISKLKHILILSDAEKIGARKCTFKEISYNDSKSFLEAFHIQGGDSSRIRFGLFYGQEIVAVMTFLKTSKVGVYKLNRYATNHNYIVMGGASKLLKNSIKSLNNPEKIITFADRRWTLSGNDNLYTKIGFELVYETQPNYFYINIDSFDGVRYSRIKFQKHKILKRNPQFSKKMTERQMMTALGYDRIYDCGNFKYEITI